MYHPETHELRFCTHCQRWYHVSCLEPRDTVANLRALPATTGSKPAWWIVWDAPAAVPRDVGEDLENLVTMPIQRGYRPGPRGAHPLLSAEKFTLALRRCVKDHRYQPPTTTAEAEVFVHNLLKACLFDKGDPAFRESTAYMRWFSRIPFTERVIYKCPQHPSHFL